MQLRWGIGCQEAYPPWRAIKKDGAWLRSKFGFIAAGDHRNITYVMAPSTRPAYIQIPARDRLNRMCLDWAHENFKIYSVPGVDNTFNDYHTRNGAPNAAPFVTLVQHAEQVELRLAALRESAAKPDSEKIRETIDNTCLPPPDKPREEQAATADIAIDTGITAIATREAKLWRKHDGHSQPRKTGRAAERQPGQLETIAEESTKPNEQVARTAQSTDNEEQTDDPTCPCRVVRQHLVIIAPPRQPNLELQQWDRNLAGQRLLPEMEPRDWPTAKDISEAQEYHFSALLKANLTRVQSDEPGVYLYLSLIHI